MSLMDIDNNFGITDDPKLNLCYQPVITCNVSRHINERLFHNVLTKDGNNHHYTDELFDGLKAHPCLLEIGELRLSEWTADNVWSIITKHIIRNPESFNLTHFRDYKGIWQYPVTKYTTPIVIKVELKQAD